MTEVGKHLSGLRADRRAAYLLLVHVRVLAWVQGLLMDAEMVAAKPDPSYVISGEGASPKGWLVWNHHIFTHWTRGAQDLRLLHVDAQHGQARLASLWRGRSVCSMRAVAEAGWVDRKEGG